MGKYMLGIDIGTSACKAAVFSRDGRVLASRAEGYAVDYPQPCWAQQDPEDWWQAACRAIRELTAAVDPADIAAVGVDGQSWAAVAVDAEGKVLAPTPIWTERSP